MADTAKNTRQTKTISTLPNYRMV